MEEKKLLRNLVEGAGWVSVRVLFAVRQNALCAVCIKHYLYGSIVVLFEKVKAIPLHAWAILKGSRRLRLPDFLSIGT
jgi:hypothetical protein